MALELLTKITSVGISGGLDITGIVTATSAVVGTGVTINSTGINAAAGIVTASTVVCESTTQAFYPPVVTTTQRDAMTVTQGAMVFNSTDKKMQFYDGTQWMSLPGVTLGLGIGVF